MILLDANYLLRFLIRDDEQSYAIAKECMQNRLRMKYEHLIENCKNV